MTALNDLALGSRELVDTEQSDNTLGHPRHRVGRALDEIVPMKELLARYSHLRARRQELHDIRRTHEAVFPFVDSRDVSRLQFVNESVLVVMVSISNVHSASRLRMTSPASPRHRKWNTHWHKTYPSLRASPKCLRSRSSPPPPSPLKPEPALPAAALTDSCVALAIKDEPLLPHTLSNLANDLSLTSTSSYTMGSKPDCAGGLSISLIRSDEAVRTSSRCSEVAVVASETVDALMERIWERLGDRLRCVGDIARGRIGVDGEAARPGVGEDEKLTLWLSDERRIGVAGAGGEEDKGRWEVDADGWARWVGVREDDRACEGLRGRAAVGDAGGVVKGR